MFSLFSLAPNPPTLDVVPAGSTTAAKIYLIRDNFAETAQEEQILVV